MKITVSVIKADVGGIGGHTRPSEALIQAVRDTVNNSKHSKQFLGATSPLVSNS